MDSDYIRDSFTDVEPGLVFLKWNGTLRALLTDETGVMTYNTMSTMFGTHLRPETIKVAGTRIYDLPSLGDGMFTLMTREQLQNQVWHHPDSAAIVTGDPRHPPDLILPWLERTFATVSAHLRMWKPRDVAQCLLTALDPRRLVHSWRGKRAKVTLHP